MRLPHIPHISTYCLTAVLASCRVSQQDMSATTYLTRVCTTIRARRPLPSAPEVLTSGRAQVDVACEGGEALQPLARLP